MKSAKHGVLNLFALILFARRLKTGSAGNLVLPNFPNLGASDIIGLLGSLLGVSVMRSYEKKVCVDTRSSADKTRLMIK